MTLGCSKNQVISQKFSYSLLDKGYIEVKRLKDADFVIINSCGFIEDALSESIEETLLAYKNKNKNSKIILTGCAANLYKDQLRENLIETDYIFDYNDFYSFFNIAGYENNCKRSLNNRKWEYLLISEGCSKFCTFCTIPLIKGPYRSFDLFKLLKEVQLLKDNGIEEVILISQDTANYGKDINTDKEINLLKILVEKIYLLGIKKIRLLYFNLDSIESEDKMSFIDKIFSSNGVVPYFEIPLQNLIDETLKRMGRKTRFSEIEYVLNKIKEKYPISVIRTSIITGFPGETDEDYLLLKKRLLSLPIDYLNVFAYSDMEKASSYKFKNKVDEIVKINRRNDLMQSFEDSLSERLQRFIGTEGEVNIESEDKDFYITRSWMQSPEIDGLTYIYKNKDKDKNSKNRKNYKVGDRIKIRITDSFFYDFYGEII